MEPAELLRCRQRDAGEEAWDRWGTYLSDRQWGTVREDYSADGNAWASFPFDHSHLRTYRWGEDGLLGLCDERGLLCLAPVLWNGEDPILKERLFGLGNPEGNHGEDIKEAMYHLAGTPTGSYAKALYRYPQTRFPTSNCAMRIDAAAEISPNSNWWTPASLTPDAFSIWRWKSPKPLRRIC
ncbi:hypothetical protein [Synechococcus sp. RS9917]|uniref:hypothetical protein n=1 Tax=Synechococcus sp. RS9917 TaxID=221360 RepID=UPI000068F5B7|nr:hypothetical protein [Synechococcus sp. RS9917]EAQ69831.1 hypothetical protein RS9917_10356 [Synechococcus sp. RS9917]